MKKNISVVTNGLIIDIGRFRKSHIDDWVVIYSREGERIGGFSFSDVRLKVIDNYKLFDDIHLLYAIIDREGVK